MASSGNTEGTVTPVDFIQLQEYMQYSTLRVKDMIKEFQSGGRLAQHSSREYVDKEGFSLFLKTYLEVDDLPADFCQHLFLYFQSFEQDSSTENAQPKGGVLLSDVSCYLSVLEEGQPREKLEFTFKLYDKDSNGHLDSSEVDRIITQMMRAADYLGWDIAELKTVLKDMMTAIDVDDSGTVTLEEWLKGGMNNVPLLVLLGLKVPDRDGQHNWRMKNFNKPAYCCVCQSMLLGLRKQGLRCTCCSYTAHSRCSNKNVEPCAPMFVKSKQELRVPSHDWVRSDRSSKCQVCQKKIKTLAGRLCVWCHQMRHDECIYTGISTCDCGLLKDHILPPWAIHANAKEQDANLMNMTPDGNILQIVPIPDIHPLLVFVNPKSGGNQGERVLCKFQYLLNPRQVYNLSNGGPAPGLHFFRNLRDYRILACGGDGTAGWILDAIDKAGLQVNPQVAILPLGTGNDLARCLRWGGGYDGSDLKEILKDIEASELIQMDRWRIQVTPNDPKQVRDPVPYHIINNYFSVGSDASVAHQFHSMREKFPQRFNSRMKNKLWYLEFATSETISSTCKNLTDCLAIECCGKRLDLSTTSLACIAVLNIPSMYGGSNLWGESSKADAPPRVQPDEVITDPEILKTTPQDMTDKRLEVVGLEGMIEMGQIYTGLKSAGHRLAQASQITIRTFKDLPMQIDGEPWMQPPCTIHITHKNQANMLMAPPAKPSGFFHLK
ncbi:diacylglycerol kinase alpha-like isoform X2 [Syngnathoides biaculeatus]|uniref:diacylglycerol kinase alpha-like isoform X2 n=1 Tax=Syngnathoides biaculeatus TaxID=300417 RepID=UPI002ADDD767|nr:diacylglycerol kinase alpha-like isoform X2 [Syngnathoides biaculeatus]